METETELRSHARECLLAGIDAATPETVLTDAVQVDGSTLRVDGTAVDLDRVEDCYLVGGGNAAGAAAHTLEGIVGEWLTDGAVVTDDPQETSVVTTHRGAHPLPSEENVAGTTHVLEIAEEANEDDLVLVVVSGGGSALLCAPAEGISLADLRTVTDRLLKRGADIDEINAVRKHCSAIKGGQLARAAAPATVVGLVFSDVVGNRLDVIASGPTAPDDSTHEEALAVLDQYGLVEDSPVRGRLSRGTRGELPETPRRGDEAFDAVTNHVLADTDTALDAAAETAADLGYGPLVLTSRIRGEASEAAKTQVALGEEVLTTGRPVQSPAALLTGGETTVTVDGDGSGGPNLEFALSAAIELDDDGIAVGSVDTDGYDGGTDVAGAVVDADTISRDDEAAARASLADNDAFGFFEGSEELVVTGPTGTNVNDLRVVLVESPEHVNAQHCTRSK
ncbi:glycerate kinase type-2 family protein [Haloarchaeobius sp. DFWS5]|uniref:glycerate kinase type-2 family protein n=1 Tax=Haloarchaeobius sp. DFWS5 TaxID=3446114 RepID=UPI003EBC008B